MITPDNALIKNSGRSQNQGRFDTDFIPQNKLADVKNAIRRLWDQVPSQELDDASGSVTALAELVARHSGEEKEDVMQRLNQIVSRGQSREQLRKPA